MPPSLSSDPKWKKKAWMVGIWGYHFCVSGKCCWSSPLEYSCLEWFLGRTLCSELNTAPSSPRILPGTPGPKSSQSSDGPRAGEETPDTKKFTELLSGPSWWQQRACNIQVRGSGEHAVGFSPLM